MIDRNGLLKHLRAALQSGDDHYAMPRYMLQAVCMQLNLGDRDEHLTPTPGADDGTLNTCDASVWARAFMRRLTDGTFTVLDESLMLGWFANAIEYAAANHPDVVRLKQELQGLQDRVNVLRKDAMEAPLAEPTVVANTPSLEDWEALCKRLATVEDRISYAATAHARRFAAITDRLDNIERILGRRG